jgi:hypothetical protein
MKVSVFITAKSLVKALLLIVFKCYENLSFHCKFYPKNYTKGLIKAIFFNEIGGKTPLVVKPLGETQLKSKVKLIFWLLTHYSRYHKEKFLIRDNYHMNFEMRI